MRRHNLRLGVLVAVVMLVIGCGHANQNAATGTVHIRDIEATFLVEIAQTAQQQRDGLSHRTQLPDGTGMLFRFAQPRSHKVWMPNMRFPLDIAWIANDTIVGTQTITPCTESDSNRCPSWTSPQAVDALLEVPAHSLAAARPGMSVTLTQH